MTFATAGPPYSFWMADLLVVNSIACRTLSLDMAPPASGLRRLNTM